MDYGTVLRFTRQAAGAGTADAEREPRRGGDSSARNAESERLAAARTGDRAALAELLTPHEAALYRLCRGMLPGSRSDAEDAVQKTLLRAIRALLPPGAFRSQASISTYLYRIAVNVCLEQRRQNARHPLADDISPTRADPPSREPGPEAQTILRDEARRFLAALPPRHRLLIFLKEQEGLGVAEIASLLQWNAKKVQNELFKARRTLSDLRPLIDGENTEEAK